MAVALDPAGCFSYVLQAERANDRPTTWRLRFLSGRELDAIKARMPVDEKDISMGLVDDVLALGLRGWSSYADSSGCDVHFPDLVTATVCGMEARCASPDALARIGSMLDRVELMGAIMQGQQLTVSAAKKSKSPPP